MNCETRGFETSSNVCPGAGDEVCFGAGAGQVGDGGCGAVEFDMDLDDVAAFVLDLSPVSGRLLCAFCNDDVLCAVNEVLYALLNDTKHLVCVVRSRLYDPLQHVEPCGSASSELLIR